jgi:hypothetical protein
MILKLKWAALDKAKPLQQPQPRIKVKQKKQSKCMYKKNVPTTYLQTYKAFKKKGSNRSSTKAI